MNTKILRKISLIILPLLVIGVATYFLITSNTKEVKAIISPSGRASDFDLFKSYKTWPTSTTPKTNTAAEWLHTMSNETSRTPTTASTFADVNGDGLNDILVHYEFVAPEVSGWRHYYGILLNRGDLKFDLVYKCVHVDDDAPDKFYGDCAAL